MLQLVRQVIFMLDREKFLACFFMLLYSGSTQNKRKKFLVTKKKQNVMKFCKISNLAFFVCPLSDMEYLICKKVVFDPRS